MSKNIQMYDNAFVILWIGAKIRELRVLRNWKLGDLAESSGVSIAMLSKIENGRVFPTIPTLLQVLKVLEVDINSFFEGITENFEFQGHLLIRKQDYSKIQKEDAVGFSYERVLTQNISDLALEVSLLTLSEGAQREKVTTEGFEYIYLLKGDITFTLGDKQIDLHEGDSLYFDGRIPHVPSNNLACDSVLLVIYFITT